MTFSAEYVDLLYRDNYRHVLLLDSVDLMVMRQCVWYLTIWIHVYSLVQMHLKLSVNTSIWLQFFNSQNIYHSTNWK